MKVQALIVLLATSSAVAQSTFQNLDFESAVFVPGPGGFEFASAFPGWKGYIGTNVATSALSNNIALDSAGFGLWGPGSVVTIGGNCTAMIQSGYTLTFPLQPVNASLSQIGLVPSDARSLQFKASTGGAFQVTLGGQLLSLTPLLSGPNYTLVGADVSSFSGNVAELRFTPLTNSPPHPPVDTLYLDDIVFSPSTIPEPSVLALCALATALLGSGRLRGPQAPSRRNPLTIQGVEGATDR